MPSRPRAVVVTDARDRTNQRAAVRRLEMGVASLTVGASSSGRELMGSRRGRSRRSGQVAAIFQLNRASHGGLWRRGSRSPTASRTARWTGSSLSQELCAILRSRGRQADVILHLQPFEVRCGWRRNARGGRQGIGTRRRGAGDQEPPPHRVTAASGGFCRKVGVGCWQATGQPPALMIPLPSAELPATRLLGVDQCGRSQACGRGVEQFRIERLRTKGAAGVDIPAA